MTREDRLADILKSTSAAHSKAFASTNGEDAEWPKWYAEHLLKETDFSAIIPGLIEANLAHLLEMLDHQYNNDNSRQSWPHYYARKLLKIG